MDLRSRIRTPDDLAEVKHLISQTHFTYQPFRLSDDLEVGGGYEFLRRQPGAGLVYWPSYEAEKHRYPGYPLKTVDPSLKTEFTAANAGLRAIYDGFVDQIAQRLDIRALSVADIGCFNGYMPAAFALRGAPDAVGYDQDDRSGCFRFLNRILGIRARFIHAGYDLASGTMPGQPDYDLVISMSVLQHMAEPFRHIHFLRSLTRRALFLVTNVWSDEDLLVRYGEPNAVFQSYAFPWCFDNSAYLSDRLLAKALEKAGFVRTENLEFRLPPSEQQTETRGAHDYATQGEHAKTLDGRALLCFVDGPARGAQKDLRLGYRR